jgi:hypothetical protein
LFGGEGDGGAFEADEAVVDPVVDGEGRLVDYVLAALLYETGRAESLNHKAEVGGGVAVAAEVAAEPGVIDGGFVSGRAGGNAAVDDLDVDDVA